MEEFDHLKIQLEDIILATNNFVPNKRIGGGGFGWVYKGELSHPEGLLTVACKRLDPASGQGHIEFLKEIQMLSKCKHENLISLLHFCIEGDEKILLYEYASRGSLDRYLSDPSLTWTQRLKICIGVARALNYLHDPADTQQRILHRDIKSSNILLDEEWNVKVSDFGLSKFGPANLPQTFIVSNAVGTYGYCDPLYCETGILSKESDVYSFGVVMFEVMCGTLCYEHCDGRLLGILVSMWKTCFEEKRLDDIIFHGLKEHMEPGSVNTFSTIAYKCLMRMRKERPTMAEIMQALEIALEQQESFEGMRWIADLAVSPLSYTIPSQLLLLFMKGMLVDNGKTWFCVNKKGQHCELISAAKCVSTSETVIIAPNTKLVSRFQHLLKYVSTQDLRLTVKTQFLSPNVTYIINLVYECHYPHNRDLRIPFKYKLEQMKEYSTLCVAHVGEDGWRRTELFQFTSTKKEHYFDIQFSNEMKFAEHQHISISIEGVEFCPADYIEKDENKVNMQPQPTDDNIDWGERLPNYIYTKIIKCSKDIEESSMTRKEVYFLLRKGVYINNSEQWLSISKKSRERLMLPARTILAEEISGWNFLSLPGSRFKEAAECGDINHLVIRFQFEPHLLPSHISYTCYLVFKLPENASVFEGVVIACFDGRADKTHSPSEHHIYLVTPPHTPIIELSPDDRPSRTRKVKGHPKLRKDGWMEIQLCDVVIHPNYTQYWRRGYLKSLNKWNFTGLLVKGIELRPAKVSWDSYPRFVGDESCLVMQKETSEDRRLSYGDLNSVDS